MIETISIIYLSLFCLVLSVIFHEIGHVFALRQYGRKKARVYFYYDNWKRFGIKTGKAADYMFLNRKQRIGVGVFGIILGFFPILFFSVLLKSLTNICAF